MLDHATAEKRIASWFLTQLKLEIPSPETDLFETGVLDSLGFVELMVHLEEAFGIKIALEQVEIDNFRSIERIAAFLLNGHGAGAVHFAGSIGREPKHLTPTTSTILSPEK